MALRVLLADDEVLLSAGLTRLLEDAGIEVVATVARADEVLEAVAEHRPDVAITDVQMPPTGTDDGLRAAIEVRRAFPETAVLVLSNFLEERYPLDLIGEDAKGVGYLLKSRVGDVGLVPGVGAARGRRRLGAGPRGRRSGWCRAAAATRRSTTSPRASARCSR